MLNPFFRKWLFCLICLGTFSSVLLIELFVPPIVGLSDNGDFAREVGYFGYGPAQRDPPLTWVYVAPLYVRGPVEKVRQENYEQFTSDFLFVKLAIGISRIIPGNGTLPITIIGAVHAGALIAAVARLFFVTSFIRGHKVLWVASVIVFTDVGYVAYANSFFAETASGVFAIWALAEAIVTSREKTLSWKLVVALLLLLSAKPQNVTLIIPISLFCFFAGSRSRLFVRGLSVTALIAAAIATVSTVKEIPRLETTYNMLFSAVLPESRDPRGDLSALGLDPEFVAFKGSLAWSSDSGLYIKRVRDAVQAIGPFSVVFFYLKRPTRFWRHITTLFPIATQIRPEACGNFEPSAGRQPGARATKFSLWSTAHERVLGRVTKFLVFGLLATMIVSIGLFKRRSLAPVTALLSAIGITAFLTAAFGDANEPIKHQYLFNLSLDLCLLLGLTWLISFVANHRSIER